MVNFTSRSGIKSNSDISQLTGNATLYFHIYPTSVSGSTYTILDLSDDGIGNGDYRVYIENSTLNFWGSANALIGSGDDGRWTVPISANTNYQVAISYDFSGNDSANPVIYLNGVSQTVTEAEVPDSINAHVAGVLSVGERDSGINTFSGYIGEIAIFNTALSSTQMEQITSSRLMRLPLQYSSCIHYFGMDEFPNGGEIATAHDLLPTSDIATPWDLPTPHYTRINADDGTTLFASSSDDNKQEEFGMDTYTLGANEKFINMRITIVDGYDDQGDGITVKRKKGGGSFENVATGYDMGVTSTHTWDDLDLTWTQSQVDGLEVALLSPTMGTTSEIGLDLLKATIYTGYVARDYLSSLFLIGFDATGHAQNYLSY